MDNIYMIKNVKLDLTHYTGEDQYTDGSIEDEILEALKAGKGEEMLYRDNRWPVVYHLSPVRHYLLDCINFKPNSSVLEIGCGCGAISGMLCKKAARVDAVEISPRRAEIAAYRNQEYSNLTIHVGNLNDMEFTEKYDYVTLIGVLEYAGAFTKTDNPWHDFLENCRQYLKPDGILIIAIENRLGMKYWSGAAEDHTGKLFDGITGYKGNKKIRTFSRKELKDLLYSAGYIETQWFYPYPDYKLPMDLYSDEYDPKIGDFECIWNMPYDFDRCELFSEVDAFTNLKNTGLFPELSNSFLVLCHQNKLSDDDTQPIYVHHSSNRKKHVQIGTTIMEKNGKRIIHKLALNDESKKHLQTIYENCQILNKEYGKEHVAQCWLINDELLEMEYIDGENLEDLTMKALHEEGVNGFIGYIQFYCDYILRGIGSNINSIRFKFNDPRRRYNIDTHLRNIIYKDGNYIFIDYEWLLPYAPKEYLLWRMINCTFTGFESELEEYGLDISMIYHAANIDNEKRNMYARTEIQLWREILTPYLKNYEKKRRGVRINI